MHNARAHTQIQIHTEVMIKQVTTIIDPKQTVATVVEIHEPNQNGVDHTYSPNQIQG